MDTCRFPSATDEHERLATLTDYDILDTPPEADFDRVVALAAELFQCPTALVSLIDRERQWFKARVGLDLSETSREVSFCSHALYNEGVLVVPDARKDGRFAENPLVTGDPGIRFYAGAPLVAPNGHKLGTLCIIDAAPRQALTERQVGLLSDLAALVMDRMELRRLQRAREASQQRFERISATSPNGIICADGKSRISYWNPACEELFGYTADEALGQTLDLIIPARLRSAHAAGMARLNEGGKPRLVGKSVEVVARRRDNSEFPIELSLSMWEEEGELSFGAMVRDISVRRRDEERLRHLAYDDQLTKLPNRASLRDRLQTALKDSPGKAQGAATLILIDLDGFKEINDTLGHAAGDRILKEVARRLQRLTREGNTVARLGADEFAILLPALRSAEQASETAERVLRVIARPFRFEGQNRHLGASIGIASGPAHGSTAEEVMINADLALNQAKSEGGRAFHVFEPQLRLAAMLRRSLEEELRRAAARNEFELHYQPQVRLSDGSVCGAEALLRWRHPERGLLAPGAFLGVLESSPMAAPVGDWIIRAACAEAGAWRAAGLDLRIGVNLFAAQFRSGGLVATTREALTANGLPPDALELEITENIALGHDDIILAPLKELRRSGIGVAFDDFGTGFASLSTLRRFPISRLKIDQTFVRTMITDAGDAAIVEAILALGRSMKLDIIAEGIEGADQEAMLARLGCPEGQGYFYGKPMPAAAFRAFCLRPEKVGAA